ncbi:AsmA protein [Klebsiella michiganensis]|nr:AsmA protein [Klebsiella michiganensis]
MPATAASCWGDQPDWTLNLQAGTLNLDSLLSHASASGDNSVNQQGQSQNRQLRPVIADNDIQQDYNALRGFNARLNLTADQLQWRGMHFTQVKSEISNQQGLLTIHQMQGSLDGGRLSLPARSTRGAQRRMPLSSRNSTTLRSARF